MQVVIFIKKRPTLNPTITNKGMDYMKALTLAQYFTVTMVITVTLGLLTLKPVINQDSLTKELVNNVIKNNQERFFNDQYK